MKARQIAVVGSGIHGLLCAWLLIRKGHRVELFEQGAVPNPYAASHGLHRLLHPWNAAGDPMMAEAAAGALRSWKRILAEIGSDAFEPTGILVLDDRSGLAFDGLGIASSLIDGTALSRRLPFAEIGSGHSARLFHDFGVLFAGRILGDLVKALRTAGLRIHAHTRVEAINARTGSLHLADAGRVSADLIILATGTGTRALLPADILPADPQAFSPRRCYVAYVEWPDYDTGSEGAAWASLGRGDLWGMPPLRGELMKLGNGAFTRPADPAEPDDAAAVARELLKSYVERFPALGRARLVRCGANHWTRIGSRDAFMIRDRLVVVTSDDGGGFKTAPQVAEAIVARISDAPMG
ncbi:MAG: NAD(P)/FAD-dependent oxidoreductase [Salinarimonas sp.]